MKKQKDKYVIVCEELICEGLTYRSFGLAWGDFVIHHISVDEVFVEQLAAVLNRAGMAPAQALELVDLLLP